MTQTAPSLSSIKTRPWTLFLKGHSNFMEENSNVVLQLCKGHHRKCCGCRGLFGGLKILSLAESCVQCRHACKFLLFEFTDGSQCTGSSRTWERQTSFCGLLKNNNFGCQRQIQVEFTKTKLDQGALEHFLLSLLIGHTQTIPQASLLHLALINSSCWKRLLSQPSRINIRTPGLQEAIMVKCLAQEETCHRWDSNPRSHQNLGSYALSRSALLRHNQSCTVSRGTLLRNMPHRE